jgi:hypothetical protein
VEDFPWHDIFKFDLSRSIFQTSFGGWSLNVNDFHHQKSFEIWNEAMYIWNSKQREVLQWVSCLLDFDLS